MPGSLLEAFVRVAPYLCGLFAQDTAVSVLDREKVLIYVPGRKLDQKVKPGDPFVPSALVCRAITEGRRMVGRVGREVFGVPYVGRAIPIVEEGRIVGGISVSESIENEEFLLEIAGRLSGNVQDVTAAGEQLAAATQQLAAAAATLSRLAENAAKDVGRGDQVLEFIEEIAVNTNLLGINAAIEAAHIGHLGAGFNVVAREIRALADKTARYAKEAGEVIGSINKIIEDIRKHLQDVSRQAQEQSQTTQSMAGNLMEINRLAEELVSLAARLKGQDGEDNVFS
ncbi:MAG: methyl-accepting chemotaxis protein, partial [Bacillota bacterium]